ncbi:MAG TPA: hypothetical protein DER01_23400 [Phycisphaerales bacterium]|nr:hypothetical protein [Phycisphaerales bacterium]|tara:strand:+ start:14476 stop:16668 length:2193 start_codon:yes stop_codon:yes gene_type:complete
MLDTRLCLKSLSRWLKAAQTNWVDLPDHPGLGFYGTGYNTWAVQTNQKFIAAAATMAVMDDRDTERNLKQALSALRYCLATHKTGPMPLTDGSRWGHTWISVLGLERMMYVFKLLEDYLSEEDQADAKRVLTSEADWITYHLERGSAKGVHASKWNKDGNNDPESHMWNGSFLWRIAQMYPEHENKADWIKQSNLLLFNAITTEADADHELYVGPQFFENYALDHHGYMNVGYMVITLSNAAMLYFDLKHNDWPMPEHLKHNLENLWRVTKKMIFADGRLARIGGDSRVRYAYCQEYLLHSMMMAADLFGDTHATYLCASQLQTLAKEQNTNTDGSYYGLRLDSLKKSSPYYYTRIESDRACAVAAAMHYNSLVKWPSSGTLDFESDVAGLWIEKEHGDVLHRSPTRFASVSWHASGLGQAMCQPPDDGNIAEWSSNLCSVVKFMGDKTDIQELHPPHRDLEHFQIDGFEGGFATLGRIREGVNIEVKEGWRSTQLATLQQAFIALPDGQTLIGMHHCRTGESRSYPTLIQGMHLNLPNDLYNGYQRTLSTPEDQLTLATETRHDHVVDLNCTWVNIDHRIGVVGVYGANQLCIDRTIKRRGGPYQSLHVDELCYGYQNGADNGVSPYSMILDIGFVIGSNINTQDTQELAKKTTHKTDGDLRTMQVLGADGRMYVACANFGVGTRTVPTGPFWPSTIDAINLVTGEKVTPDDRSFTIPGSSAAVYLLDM